jgi:REP element-mobilizing transposase RayT
MKELPKRKPNRLIDYDYSREGAYFVTICSKERENLFGTVIVGVATCHPYVKLSDIGQAIDIAINNVSQIYPSVSVDIYVIMPNHLHMVLVINNDDGRYEEHGRQVAAPTTVQTIIGNLKRFVSIQCGYSVW